MRRRLNTEGREKRNWKQTKKLDILFCFYLFQNYFIIAVCFLAYWFFYFGFRKVKNKLCVCDYRENSNPTVWNTKYFPTIYVKLFLYTPVFLFSLCSFSFSVQPRLQCNCLLYFPFLLLLLLLVLVLVLL